MTGTREGEFVDKLSIECGIIPARVAATLGLIQNNGQKENFTCAEFGDVLIGSGIDAGRGLLRAADAGEEEKEMFGELGSTLGLFEGVSSGLTSSRGRFKLRVGVRGTKNKGKFE